MTLKPEYGIVSDFVFLKIFWNFGCKACGFLVLQPGWNPDSPALERWILNHWTVRKSHPKPSRMEEIVFHKRSDLWGNLSLHALLFWYKLYVGSFYGTGADHSGTTCSSLSAVRRWVIYFFNGPSKETYFKDYPRTYLICCIFIKK